MKQSIVSVSGLKYEPTNTPKQILQYIFYENHVGRGVAQNSGACTKAVSEGPATDSIFFCSLLFRFF